MQTLTTHLINLCGSRGALCRLYIILFLFTVLCCDEHTGLLNLMLLMSLFLTGAILQGDLF